MVSTFIWTVRDVFHLAGLLIVLGLAAFVFVSVKVDDWKRRRKAKRADAQRDEG